MTDTAANPAKEQFSEDEHKIWTALCANLIPRIEKYACDDYKRGYELLHIPTDRIPSLGELEDEIRPRTGWRLERTRNPPLRLLSSASPFRTAPPRPSKIMKKKACLPAPTASIRSAGAACRFIPPISP